MAFSKQDEKSGAIYHRFDLASINLKTGEIVGHMRGYSNKENLANEKPVKANQIHKQLNTKQLREFKKLIGEILYPEMKAKNMFFGGREERQNDEGKIIVTEIKAAIDC